MHPPPPRTISRRRLLGGLLAIGLGGCARDREFVHPGGGAKDGGREIFGYRRWIAPGLQPDVVVIGIHGFNGDSRDYENLGRHLLLHQPRSAVYAYNVRGQGSDPIVARRGDIGHPAEWYRDLFVFTRLVRERHPRAKVVWFGESMGALIAAHAWREAPEDAPPCDGLILSSPVVRFNEEVPQWKIALVRVAAATVPHARVSLDALAGGRELRMTHDSVHDAQSATNDYHVDAYSLRLLGALTTHINGMNRCAASFSRPLLLLHGGRDFFTTDGDQRGFVARVPEGVPVTYRHYPEGHHLLMYDARRDRVFRDVERWLDELRRDSS